jgi:hypothetical protein
MILFIAMLISSFIAQAEVPYPILATYPGVNLATFSPDGKMILTFHEHDRLLSLINIKNQRVKRSNRVSTPHFLGFSKDSRYYFQADHSTCKVGNSYNGKIRYSFPCIRSDASHGSDFFSLDGMKVLRKKAENRYQVLDLSKRRPSVVAEIKLQPWKIKIPPYCSQRSYGDKKNWPNCSTRTKWPTFKFELSPDGKRVIVRRISEIEMYQWGGWTSHNRTVGTRRQIMIWDINKNMDIYNRQVIGVSSQDHEGFSASFSQDGLSALVVYPLAETGPTVSYLDFKTGEIKDMEMGSVEKGALSSDGKKMALVLRAEESARSSGYSYLSVLEMPSENEIFCYAYFDLRRPCQNSPSASYGDWTWKGLGSTTDQMTFSPDNKKIVATFLNRAGTRGRGWFSREAPRMLIFDIDNNSPKHPYFYFITYPKQQDNFIAGFSKVSFSRDSSKLIVNHPNAGLLIDLATNTKILSTRGDFSLSQDGNMLLRVLSSGTDLIDISGKK